MSLRQIILVEDDIVAARAMSTYFESNGVKVTHLESGKELVPHVEKEAPDALVLDGRLPDIDGFELCRAIRSQFGGPIVMLTSCDDDMDELLGLELGADDYIRKPTPMRITMARLKACTRRRAATAPAETAVMQFQDLRIDTQRRSATIADRVLDLTDAEFDLLAALASAAGQVLSRDDLFKKTRHIAFDGLDRSIDMRIVRLRRVLGDNPQDPAIIKTVRGKGYLFVPPVAPLARPSRAQKSSLRTVTKAVPKLTTSGQ